MAKGILKRKGISIILTGILFLGLFIQLVINLRESLSENYLAGFYISRDLGAHLLDSLDFGSTIITCKSNPHFLFFYLQTAEGYRLDVAGINIDSFENDDILRKYMSNKMEKGVPLYWVGGDKTGMLYRSLVPYGLVFRCMEKHNLLDPETFKTHIHYRKLFERRLSGDKYQNEYETYAELYRINTELFRYYSLRQRMDLAEKEFSELLTLNQDSPYLNLFSAISLFERGKLQEAKNILMRYQEYTEKLRGRLYDRQRGFLSYLSGMLALRGKKYTLAEYFLKEALKMNPKDENTRYYLAATLYEQGKLDEARRHCLISYGIARREDCKELLNRIEEKICKE